MVLGFGACIGFVLLRPLVGHFAAKTRSCAENFQPETRKFFVLEEEERRNAVVLTPLLGKKNKVGKYTASGTVVPGLLWLWEVRRC